MVSPTSVVEPAAWTNRNISSNLVLDDNTYYNTGSNFVVNHGVQLTVPLSSVLEIHYYETQKSL